jgi:hypothetical protein
MPTLQDLINANSVLQKSLNKTNSTSRRNFARAGSRTKSKEFDAQKPNKYTMSQKTIPRKKLIYVLDSIEKNYVYDESFYILKKYISKYV